MAALTSQIILVWAVAVLQVVSSDSTPYIYKGNPYNLGQLGNRSFVLDKAAGAPLHTTVIYPEKAGNYPILYFVPGGPEGVIPAEWYGDTLQRVVSHGFIVAAVDQFYPLVTLPSVTKPLNSASSTNIQHVNWLKQNLQKHVDGSVKVLPDRLALGCHSAGCEVTLQMLQDNSSIANSTIFLEPFSLGVLGKNLGLKVPAYMYGTQLSEEMSPCSIPGVDYKAFYEKWACPKWMTVVANYGHCDILDHLWWESCHYGHFCKTVGNWSLVYPKYHEYVSGAISSFLIGTLQEYGSALQYIENPALIPLDMQSINSTAKC